MIFFLIIEEMDFPVCNDPVYLGHVITQFLHHQGKIKFIVEHDLVKTVDLAGFHYTVVIGEVMFRAVPVPRRALCVRLAADVRTGARGHHPAADTQT